MNAIKKDKIEDSVTDGIDDIIDEIPDDIIKPFRLCCVNCIFFRPSNVINIGDCRRRAPYSEGFPKVTEKTWCGEHVFDETKVDADLNE